MRALVWWNRVAFSVLIFGAFILAFALTLQPKVSDDFYVLWSFQKTPGTFEWIAREYREITGRGWIILLTTFVSPYPVIETVYRGSIVGEIALLGALAWYCALGRGAWRPTRINMQMLAIFGTLLWFALPSRNETVTWLIGNFAYLVPALSGVALLAWLQSRVTTGGTDNSDKKLASGPFANIVSLILGIGAGVSHEQVVAACITYLVLVIFPVSRRFLLGRQVVSADIWFAALGLVLGAILLVSAPANYTRMGYFAAPGLKEIIERMTLYLAGAYFDLGTETSGKYVWLGALSFVALFFDRNRDKADVVAGLKRGFFWWLISLVTLLAMAPATNFISTRTTFFAVIFFYVGIAAAICSPRRMDVDLINRDEASGLVWNSVLTTGALTILGVLVVVESAVTLLSNASVRAEVLQRQAIVAKAAASMPLGDPSPIPVPFMTTQTAELTYIQNPRHDVDFLFNWGKEIGRTLHHDVRDGAPLPNSVSPLKAIKFRQKNPQQ